MGSMNQGSGPGVKPVGKDSTAGKRGKITTYGQAPNSFGDGRGGVKGVRGGAPSAGYPQGSSSRRSESGAPQTSAAGGVKNAKASSSGRGSPGSAPPPPSARRLVVVGTGPQDQNSRTLMNRAEPPSAESTQEQANRRGLSYARPDGRPPGAERPE